MTEVTPRSPRWEEWREWEEQFLPALSQIPAAEREMEGKPRALNAAQALAALAIHGQPGGFTWADVDLLRRTARAATDGTGTDAEHFRSIINRIAALMPPESFPVSADQR
ncbi:MAG TPA: hypothetical protein VF613_10550, partial [Longimicrobium sp.]